MARDSALFTAVAVLALLDGVVRGLRVNLALLLFQTLDLQPGVASLAFPLVSVVGLLLSPVGTFVAGYLWGRDAVVPEEYRRLVLWTLGAVAVGFVASYAVTTALVADEVGRSLAAKVLVDGFFAVGMVTVPLAALAGAAIAYFQRLASTRTASADN